MTLFPKFNDINIFKNSGLFSPSLTTFSLAYFASFLPLSCKRLLFRIPQFLLRFSFMASTPLSTLYGNLTIADADDDTEEIRLENIPISNGDEETVFCVVGRLVTEKPTKLIFFQDTMASIWRPAKGMNVHEIQQNLFVFRFYDEDDLLLAMEDGPWAYDQSLLVLKRMLPGENPETISLNSAEFWVQVHGLPCGFRSDGVLTAIGSFLGSLTKLDDRNFDGSMRIFYRLRISMDITKPLKKRMKLKKDSDDWIFVDFKYERLPTFCFLCGLIGHGDRYCRKVSRAESLFMEKPYGAWLRAGLRRQIPTLGQRWIAPETMAERAAWHAQNTFTGNKEGEGMAGPSSVIVAPVTVESQVDKGNPAVLDLDVHGILIRSKSVGGPIDMTESIDDDGNMVLLEQKRRRTNLGKSTNSTATTRESMDVESCVPKNLSLAGSGGSQSRPSL